VPANEFLNLQGRKFAKSLNWSIELDSFLDVFPADPMRYALASIMPETRDSDFTLEDFQARNNNELAAILGNFINRTLQFAFKNFEGKVPRNSAPGADDWFSRARSGAAASVGELIEKFRFKDALQEAMMFARACNKYFNDRAPWEAVKKRPEHAAETIARCLDAAFSLSILCEPFMPFSARRIRDMLNLDGVSAFMWSDAERHALTEGHLLGAPDLLFRRIEDDEIASALAGLNSGGENPEPRDSGKEYPPLKEQISYEHFSALDLRLGVILEAERVPKSKKLLRLLVDIGIEKRQIVAGIGAAYDPAVLAGMKIVVVANLKPAVLFGIESQGMLLAASEEGGPPVLLTVESDTPHGGVVR
jgi:methionyl-tRNA synthetase